MNWHLKGKKKRESERKEQCARCSGKGKKKTQNSSSWVRERRQLNLLLNWMPVLCPQRLMRWVTLLTISLWPALDWPPWGKISVRTRDQCESKAPLPIAAGSRKFLWTLHHLRRCRERSRNLKDWIYPRETEGNKIHYLKPEKKPKYINCQLKVHQPLCHQMRGEFLRKKESIIENEEVKCSLYIWVTFVIV